MRYPFAFCKSPRCVTSHKQGATNGALGERSGVGAGFSLRGGSCSRCRVFAGRWGVFAGRWGGCVCSMVCTSTNRGEGLGDQFCQWEANFKWKKDQNWQNWDLNLQFRFVLAISRCFSMLIGSKSAQNVQSATRCWAKMPRSEWRVLGIFGCRDESRILVEA